MDMANFTTWRVKIDEAITYGDLAKARMLAHEALEAAQHAELLGERLYFRAQLLIIDEDFAGAIKCLDTAIKHNPVDGAAYNDRALCMIELGQGDDALAYFDKGIVVEPNFATIHHNKGWYLNRLGRHDEALACFAQALALEADRAVTYENMADAYFNLGMISGAIEAYQKAVVLLSSDCDDIKKELEKLISFLQTLRSPK